MGNKSVRLNSNTERLAREVFNMIDTDGSKTIDKQETLRFWLVKKEVKFR